MTGFDRIRRRRFAAIASAEFSDDLSYRDLPEVADEVAHIAEWLTDAGLGERRFTHVYKELAANPQFAQIQDKFRDPPANERWNRSDAAVIYITGHGEVDQRRGRLRHFLVLKETDHTRLDATALATDELLRWLADTDIEYLLVIIDVCFAGQVAEELSTWARDHWLIMPSALKDQQARPGALAEAISRYLKTAEQVNKSAPYLTVRVFVDSIKQLLPQGQRVEEIYKSRRGKRGGDRDVGLDQHVCLPNPSYEPRDELLQIAPARQALALRKDVLRIQNRVNGRRPSRDHPGWLFTGRRRLMRDLIHAAGKPGVIMITGTAGCGKSTALSRLVTLSDPEFRRRYAKELSGVPADVLPLRGIVDVALSARGQSSRQVVTQVCHDLGIVAQAGSWEDPVRPHHEALSDYLAIRQVPVTIVIDALDEASDPAELVTGLLAPLSQQHPRRLCLILGVRSASGDRVAADRRGEITDEPLSDLMEDVLGARRIPADDDLRWTRRDFTTFIRNILTNTPDSPYRNAGRGAVNQVAEVISDLAGRSYLMAGVAASSAAERPSVVSPDGQGWLNELRGGLLGVFRGDLQASIPSPARLRRGVTLLRALAFARGAGLPWFRVWPKVATAVAAADGAGGDYGDRDVEWLLGPRSRLGAYLITDEQDGLTVYRLIHDELRDTLRYRWRELLSESPPGPGDGISPSGEYAPPMRADEGEIQKVEAYIARQLHDLADIDPTITVDQVVPPYVRRHLAEHAIDGNTLGKYLPVPFLPYLDLGRLRAVAGASPARQQLEENVPWLAVIQQVTHLWAWDRTECNAAAIEVWAALNEATLPGSAQEPGPVGGWWRVRWAVQPPDMGNVLGHHAQEVRAAATAELSGGPIAVTGGEDGYLHVWDLSTGAHYRDREPIAVTAADDMLKAISSVATARLPNGRMVAVGGSAAGTVQVWDLESHRALGGPLGDGGMPIEAVMTAVLSDWRVVVTVSDASGTIRTWDLASRELVGEPVPCGPGMALGLTNASVGGRMLGLATGQDSGLQMWDLATGEMLGPRLIGYSLTGDPSAGHPLAEQPGTGTLQGGRAIAAAVLNGREVAITGNGDGLLHWDLREHVAMERRLRGGDGTIGTIAVAQLGDRVMAVTGGNQNVQVWDLTAGEPVGELLAGHDGSVEAVGIVEVRAGTAVAVSASRDKSVRIWDVPGAAFSARRRSRQIGIVEAVTTVRSHRGDAFAVTGSHTSVQVWDLGRGDEPLHLTGHDSPVVSVAAAETADGVLVAAGHWDGAISAWWAADGRPVSHVVGEDIGAVASLATAVLADGRIVALAGDWCGSVQAWDLRAGIPIGEPMRGHTQAVVALTTTIGDDGRTLVVSGSKDGHVRVRDLGDFLAPDLPEAHWPVDADTGTEVASLTVAALADGHRCVIAGGEDGRIRLLDLRDGVLMGRRWQVCADAVTALAAGRLPDGRVAVFTGGAESLVQAWDVSTAEPIGAGLPVPGPVLGLAFQPESLDLAVGGTGLVVARPRHGDQ